MDAERSECVRLGATRGGRADEDEQLPLPALLARGVSLRGNVLLEHTVTGNDKASSLIWFAT